MSIMAQYFAALFMKYEGTKEFSKVLTKVAAMNVLENGNSAEMCSMWRYNENNVKLNGAFPTKK